jgi:integrase
MKKKLVDRTVKAAKPKDEPYEIMDGDGFGLRILPKGTKSFILFKRYPGSKNPARRTLGHYPMISLADAREKARTWLDLLDQGIDPADQERRLTEAAAAAEKATIAAALEVYCKRRLSKLRSGRAAEGTLRRALAQLMPRPVADITARDIKAVINDIGDHGFEGLAHQTFALIRAFFNWVCDTGDFGVEVSPCARLKPKALIGDRVIRDRVLSDDEIAAFWKAAEEMSYPDGPFLQLLALSACRRGEVAKMQWREVDLKGGLWTIPAARMKGGAAHVVPLVPAIRELLDSLPRFQHGDFVLSNVAGLQPVGSFVRIVARLHRAVAADLEARGLSFEHFTLHDIRRSVRTQLSKLRIPSEVAEALLAHAKPGLHRVYNMHDFQTEKAEALTLWHARLREIAPPPTPDNVVPLRVA